MRAENFRMDFAASFFLRKDGMTEETRPPKERVSPSGCVRGEAGIGRWISSFAMRLPERSRKSDRSRRFWSSGSEA